MPDNWPRYEPVTFSTAVNVSPQDLYTLNQVGLPKHALGVGSSLDIPVGVEIPGRGYLIRIAHGGFQGFFFDPSNGMVLVIHDRPGPKVRLVNSTLGQFTNTMKAVIGAFPFYDQIGDDVDDIEWKDKLAERDVIADRIGDLIRDIDPPAMNPGSFWDGFVTDVAHGEYSTEDIVREKDALPGTFSME